MFVFFPSFVHAAAVDIFNSAYAFGMALVAANYSIGAKRKGKFVFFQFSMCLCSAAPEETGSLLLLQRGG